MFVWEALDVAVLRCEDFDLAKSKDHHQACMARDLKVAIQQMA